MAQKLSRPSTYIEPGCESLPFPVELARQSSCLSAQPNNCPEERSAADLAIEAIDDVSRRIDDLARELGCLGYFGDDDDDRPRAA